MIIRYRYIRQIGQNEHMIELYSGWSAETGLIGEPVNTSRSSRFSDIRKELRMSLTAPQMACMSVSYLGKYPHLVIGEFGKTLESEL